MRRRSVLLFQIAIVCVLIAVAYRDDVGTSVEPSYMSDLVLPGWLLMLKSYSATLLAFPVLTAAVLLLTSPRTVNMISPGLGILSVLFVGEVLRFALETPERSVQLLISAVILSAIVFLAMCAAGREGREETAGAMANAFLAFAVPHVAINLILAALGYGFHESRFWGVTTQPNFLGVHMAICAMTTLGAPLRSRPGQCLRALVFAGSCLCLVLSGSRTGLILLGVGLLVFYAVRGIRLVPTLLLAGLLVLVGVGTEALLPTVPTTNMSTMDQYNRGNTRAEVWETLWDIVDAHPFFGEGKLPPVSENSYLRGWAAVGIMYPLLISALVIALILRIASYMTSYRDRRVGAMFIGVVFGTLVAGNFEGYLVDALSFAVFVFLLSIIGGEAAMNGGRRLPVDTSSAPALGATLSPE